MLGLVSFAQERDGLDRSHRRVSANRFPEASPMIRTYCLSCRRYFETDSREPWPGHEGCVPVRWASMRGRRNPLSGHYEKRLAAKKPEHARRTESPRNH